MTSPVAARLAAVGRVLESTFLGKSEAIRLLLVSAIAGEHMLLVGPPGTAKSALLRTFAKLVDARYFEYLLTRFTEPNEVFGPVDIAAFREGRYERRTAGMLPEAEIVFLDEVFKANSAILNSLLGVLNERVVTIGAIARPVPLIAAFGATNEVPTDEDLLAVYDRFLVRARSENLDGYHFHELLVRGLAHEVGKATAASPPADAAVRADEIRALHATLGERARFDEDFFALYKSLVFQIRAEGVSLSDRRAVKLLKLFAASAFLDGRATPDASDLFVLRHVWNTVEQAELLDSMVRPILDAHYRAHPGARRIGAVDVGVDALIAELNRLRDAIAGDDLPSDVQLFSHLKALQEVRAALVGIGTKPAIDATARVDQLLGHVLRSGKFGR